MGILRDGKMHLDSLGGVYMYFTTYIALNISGLYCLGFQVLENGHYTRTRTFLIQIRQAHTHNIPLLHANENAQYSKDVIYISMFRKEGLSLVKIVIRGLPNYGKWTLYSSSMIGDSDMYLIGIQQRKVTILVKLVERFNMN